MGRSSNSYVVLLKTFCRSKRARRILSWLRTQARRTCFDWDLITVSQMVQYE